MRFAVIEGLTVVNIIEAKDPIRGLCMVPDDGTAQIGGGWDGDHFTPAPSESTGKD